MSHLIFDCHECFVRVLLKTDAKYCIAVSDLFSFGCFQYLLCDRSVQVKFLDTGSEFIFFQNSRRQSGCSATSLMIPFTAVI